MLWRRRRLFASLTALLVGAAVIACACGVGASPAQAASAATADAHACCNTPQSVPSDVPAAPANEHDGCPHCGEMSAVPAAASDPMPEPAPALAAVLQAATAMAAGDALVSAPALPPLSVSPPDLLSLICALRL